MKALYLHRRRLLLTFLLLFAAGLVMQGWTYLSYIPGPATTTALVLAISGTFMAAFTVLLFPIFRCAIESAAGGFLLFRLVELTPLSGPTADFTDTPFAWAILAVCYMLVHQALYGRFWARTRFRVPFRLRTAFHTTAAPEAVWRALVENPARPQDHYSGTFHELTPKADEPGAFVCRQRVGPATMLEVIRRNVAEVPLSTYAYDFEHVVRLGGAAPERGRWSVRLTPDEGGTQVEIEERLDAALPSTVVLAWMDDLAGQVGIAVKAKLEDRRDPTVLTHMRRAAGAVQP